MKKITVGRQGDQCISITDVSVSRKHCIVTLNDDGTIDVENLSSSGTFVNGREILKKRVTMDTKVRLGGSFEFVVSDLFGKTKKTAGPRPEAASVTKAPAASRSYAEDFRKLNDLYKDFAAKKLEVQKENSVGVAGSMLPYALGAIPMVGGALRMGLMAFNARKKAKGQLDTAEYMQKLNDWFKVHYVCPKCGNFLGDVPYEALVNRNKCNVCKCEWLSASEKQSEQDRLAEAANAAADE